MSKATDYLVEQIRQKDLLIESLLNQQIADKCRAWREGWHEHYLEWERQKADPSHPITQNNPYESGCES